MKKILNTLFFTFCLHLIFAQINPTQSFSLPQAVTFALDNNNAVKNARLGIDQAKARNLEIISQGLPQIASSIDYSYYFRKPLLPGLSQIFSDTTGSTSKVFSYLAQSDPNIANILTQSVLQSKDQNISFVLAHNITAGLTYNQLIFDGRYFFGIKATKDLMTTARLSSQMSELDIKYSVTKAYYQAQAAFEAKSLLQNNLTLIDKLVSDTRKVFEEGLIEELDVNRLELAKANLESQINLQNKMSDVAAANLKFQMGLPFTTEFVLTDNLAALQATITAQSGTAFDPAKRLEYELLEKAINLQGYDMKAKRVGYFPSLYGFLNYSWNAQSDRFGDIFNSQTTTFPDGDTRSRTPWFDQGMVGLSLKIPIFDSGMKMAQVKQAKIEQIKATNNLENFKSASELQFRAAQSTYTTALSDLAILKKTDQLSEKIFKTNTIKFNEGVGSSFELAQSQQDLATNKLRYVQSIMNLLNAKADLDKAMGVK